MIEKTKISVVIFQRPPRPQAFSTERMVEKFTKALPPEIEWRVVEMPHPRTHPIDWFRNGIFARKQKADVYHIAGESHYLACFLPRKRTILTVLDCITLEKLTGFKKWILRWGYFALPAFCAGRVTAISQSSLDELRHWSKLSLKKGVVVPVPLTFETEGIKEKQAIHDRPVFLTVGTKGNKNIQRCIEAATGIPCKLLMIGKLNSEMLKLLQENQVQYENRYDLSDEELLRSYRDADCLLFPSLAEGFGMPILEAQAMGIPVITSNCSSMPEVGGSGAIYVDPTSVESIRKSMQQVVMMDDNVEDICKAGIENLNRFTPSAVASLYAEIYCRLRKDPSKNKSYT